MTLYGQIECNDFLNSGKSKIRFLNYTVSSLPPPKYGNRKTILAIVSPEFLTYSEYKNTLELSFIYTFYGLNIDKFKKISFGPFQMQLEFIDQYLKLMDKGNFSDSLLKNYKKTDFGILIDKLQTLNQIDFQWEILKTFFEYNMIRMPKNFSDFEKLIVLIRIYNSGTTEPKKTKQIFSKIGCKNLSYEEWCFEILKWH